jgi:serine/threonine protein kinase
MAGNSTEHNLTITQTIAIKIWHNKKANKMGYFVGTEEVNIFLDKKHFEDVYKKMCELNDYDDLKRGGQFGSNDDPVEGDKYNRNKWFSWMPYNYPETCPDMESILQALGIEFTLDDNGNLTNLGYWDKTGSEDYFLGVDMWSVGCIFAELMTKRPIFMCKSEMEVLNKVFNLLGTPSEKHCSMFLQLPKWKKGAYYEQ